MPSSFICFYGEIFFSIFINLFVILVAEFFVNGESLRLIENFRLKRVPVLSSLDSL